MSTEESSFTLIQEIHIDEPHLISYLFAAADCVTSLVCTVGIEGKEQS